MKNPYYINLQAESANSNVTSIANLQPKSLNPIFYGDKWQAEFYLVDNGAHLEATLHDKLFVTISDYTTGSVLPVIECIADTETGAYVAEFDLQSTAFEEVTRGVEAVDRTMEVQLSKSNGQVITLLQKEVTIRNQMLVELDVELVAPVAPTITDFQVLLFPSLPYDFTADSSPLRPSSVIVSGTGLGGDRTEVIPFAPIDVQAEVEQAPVEPSEVLVSDVTLPDAPAWVYAQTYATAPSDVVAEQLTPSTPADIVAVNLTLAVPEMAEALEMGFVPLEPSEFIANSEPSAVLDLQVDSSPLPISNLVAYDYASRPAGFLFGEPSELETKQLFRPDAPEDVVASDGAHPPPSEVEAYIAGLTAPVKAPPRFVVADRSPIEPSWNEGTESTPTSFSIGTAINHDDSVLTSAKLAEMAPADPYDWDGWRSMVLPENIVENAHRAMKTGLRVWGNPIPDYYGYTNPAVAQFQQAQRIADHISYQTSNWEQYKYNWLAKQDTGKFADYQTMRWNQDSFNGRKWDNECSSPTNKFKFITDSHTHKYYFPTKTLDYTQSNWNNFLIGGENFILFWNNQYEAIQKFAEFQILANDHGHNALCIEPFTAPSYVQTAFPNLTTTGYQQFIFQMLFDIPMFPEENTIEIEDLGSANEFVYKARLTPRFGRHAINAPQSLFGAEQPSWQGFSLAGETYRSTMHSKGFRTTNKYKIRAYDHTDKLVHSEWIYNGEGGTGLPEVWEWTDPQNLSVNEIKIEVVTYSYGKNTSSIHPMIGKNGYSEKITLNRNYIAPSAPIEISIGEQWTPEKLSAGKEPYWWFDASDEDCFTFEDYNMFTRWAGDPFGSKTFKEIKYYNDKRGKFGKPQAIATRGQGVSYPRDLREYFNPQWDPNTQAINLNRPKDLNAYRDLDSRLGWGVQDMMANLDISMDDQINYEIFAVQSRRLNVETEGRPHYTTFGGGMHFSLFSSANDDVGFNGDFAIGLGQAGYPNTFPYSYMSDGNFQETSMGQFGNLGMEYWHKNNELLKTTAPNGNPISAGSGLYQTHWDTKQTGVFSAYRIHLDVPPRAWRYKAGPNLRHSTRDYNSRSYPFGYDQNSLSNYKHQTGVYHYYGNTQTHIEIDKIIRLYQEGRMDGSQKDAERQTAFCMTSRQFFSGGMNGGFYAGSTEFPFWEKTETDPQNNVIADWRYPDSYRYEQTDAELFINKMYLNSVKTCATHAYTSGNSSNNVAREYNRINRIHIGSHLGMPYFYDNIARGVGLSNLEGWNKYGRDQNIFTHELIITPKLNISERKALQGYLAHKWKIAYRLVGDYTGTGYISSKYQPHKYSSAPPTTENYYESPYAQTQANPYNTGRGLPNSVTPTGKTIIDVNLNDSHFGGVIEPYAVHYNGYSKILTALSAHGRQYLNTFEWSKFAGYRVRANGTKIMTGEAWNMRYAWNALKDQNFYDIQNIPWVSLTDFNTSTKMPIFIYSGNNPNPNVEDMPDDGSFSSGDIKDIAETTRLEY